MKPCDCKDQNDTHSMNEQGIGINDWGITVIPNYVEMKFPSGAIKIPMTMFKKFAEWYLEDQIKDK